MQATIKTLELISQFQVAELVNIAKKKFENPKGMFNVFTVNENRFFVYFEEDDQAIVMTYEEAMEIPALLKAESQRLK